MFIKTTLIAASILTMLMVGSSSSWARGAYKWVDEDGTVHYSDRMQGSNAEIINVRVPQEDEQFDDGQAANEDPPSNADGQKSGASSKVGKSQQPSPREQKKRRKENCKIAQETLKKNLSMGRMYRIDAKGEWIYLSDAERAEVLKKSRDAVSEWCR